MHQSMDSNNNSKGEMNFFGCMQEWMLYLSV